MSLCGMRHNAPIKPGHEEIPRVDNRIDVSGGLALTLSARPFCQSYVHFAAELAGLVLGKYDSRVILPSRLVMKSFPVFNDGT